MGDAAHSTTRAQENPGPALLGVLFIRRFLTPPALQDSGCSLYLSCASLKRTRYLSGRFLVMPYHQPANCLLVRKVPLALIRTTACAWRWARSSRRTWAFTGAYARNSFGTPWWMPMPPPTPLIGSGLPAAARNRAKLPSMPMRRSKTKPARKAAGRGLPWG